jgi:hypothetical protein
MSLRPTASITNRALVLAALAEGTSRLDGVLHSDDTRRLEGVGGGRLYLELGAQRAGMGRDGIVRPNFPAPCTCSAGGARSSFISIGPLHSGRMNDRIIVRCLSAPSWARYGDIQASRKAWIVPRCGRPSVRDHGRLDAWCS